MKKQLYFCHKCKERSVLVKVYIKDDKSKGRVEFCLNKGCGYKKELPYIKEGV